MIVKTDSQGRVVGFSNGVDREGWHEVPDDVARSPMAHRLCSETDAWIEMSPQECQDRDADHTPPKPVADPSLAAMVKRARGSAGLSQKERDSLLADLAEAVLLP